MPALRSRILLIPLALGALLAALPVRVARAADPQRYSVHFVSTGDGALNTLLKASSQLQSLRKSAPVSPFALVDRAQQDIGRLQAALQSFGYYESRALITIEGRTLNDPALPGLLAAMPKRSSARVVVNFELGPRYHLGHISVQGPVSPEAVAALKLKSGDPAVSQDVLEAVQRLLSALEEEGHAYAKVDDPPLAVLQERTHTLDVTFKADPGPFYRLGSISFEGLKLVKASFLRSQLTIRPGQPYRSSDIEQARQALLNLGIFSAISVRLPPRQQVTGDEVPITFVVTERKRHAVSLDGEYSSDLGIIAGATWTDRNLFGRADQLALGANVFGLGGNGTATNGVSYDLTAQLTLPDFLKPTQSLQFELQALKPELTAYSQTAVIGGVTLARKLSSVWNVSAGVAVEEEKTQQNEILGCSSVISLQQSTAIVAGTLQSPVYEPCHDTLLSLPLTARYDSTDLVNPLLDPVHGMRAQILVTPTETLFGHHGTFTIVQANVSTYFDFHQLNWSDPGASVLALRALAGQAIGVGKFYDLPPDLRFYAGGSATVRGYAYQAFGPTFPPPDAPGDYPEGGTGIASGTIEFRQRVWGNFGLAVFVDAGAVTAPGAVTAAGTIGSGRYGFGYGGGPRYYTPIGPIRVDVAFPLNPPPRSDAFEAYIGLGQAF
ncbi:MAG TPA: BamA/TamA family outer membrane protein [Steroidobacteraceae bacterium]|nr:BamA/TamA family outer membrane protein [Steroidobacteraceae bacterium]